MGKALEYKQEADYFEIGAKWDNAEPGGVNGCDAFLPVVYKKRKPKFGQVTGKKKKKKKKKKNSIVGEKPCPTLRRPPVRKLVSHAKRRGG